MKIIADENMPLVEELFGPYGEVHFLSGRAITPAIVRDAEVLLVRSVTRVDQALLAGSAVRFVGSATSGCDHVDRAWLARTGIHFSHAPGCNAGAVVQYLLSVFCVLRPQWRDLTVGILGCGAVGGRLRGLLEALGVRCLVRDPLLPTLRGGVGLAELLRGADILCLHVPLTHRGPYATYHLLDGERLATLKPGSLLINAARGAVIDNAALRRLLTDGRKLTVALDVWENEPEIDWELWRLVDLGTPHIAGYSREGRENGSRMVYRAFCAWRGLPEVERCDDPQRVLCPTRTGEPLAEAVLGSFDVRQEADRMARVLAGGSAIGTAFDALRRSCPERREFEHFRVISGVGPKIGRDLRALGFAVD